MATLTDPGDLQNDAHVSDADFDQIEAYANDPSNASEEGAASARAGNTVENASEGKVKSHPKGDEGSSGGGTGRKTNAGAATSGSQAGGPGAGTKGGGGGLGGGKAGAAAGTGSRWSQIGAAVGKRKRGLVYTMASLILLGVLTGGFLSLVPFKLESMMKNIIKNRVEKQIRHYVVKRILGPRRLVKQYLDASVGEDDATFENKIANRSELEKQLMRNWRKPPDGGDSLEQRMTKLQNMRFERNGGNVDVWEHDAHIGNLGDSKVEDLVSNNFFEQVHNFQYEFRNPLRKMATILYNVADWAFFNKKTGPDAEKEVSGERIDKAGARLANADAAALDCAMGSLSAGSSVDCPTDEGNPDEADRTGVSDIQATQDGSAHDGDAKTGVSDSTTSATQKVKDVYNKVADHVLPGRVLSRLLSKYLADAIVQKITTAFAAAKGPLLLVAGIDIASRIDHFFWYGTADKVLVNIHKVEYAGEFFLWTTIDDNHKDGNTVSGDEFNDVMQMLDGTEKSAASKYTYGTAKTSTSTDKCDASNQSLTCVSDGNGGVQEEPFSRSIDESAHPIQDWYRRFIVLDPVIGSIGFHYSMLLWYNSAGKIWGFINKVIGAVFNLIIDAIKLAVPPLGAAIDWLMQHIGEVLAKLLLHLVGPAVDGTEVGADLFNQIDAGGAVAGMDFSRWLGGHMLNAVQARAVNEEIAAEQDAQNNKLSLNDRLFSLDNPRSVVSILAMQAPVSPAGAVSDGMDYVGALTSNPYQTLAPLFRVFGVGNAGAANMPADGCGYGLYCWGYTDQDLAQDDHGAALNTAYDNAKKRLGTPTVKLGDVQLNDCPAVDPPHTPPDKVHPNVCRLDVSALQSMNSDFTKDDDGGLNSAGGPQ